MIKTIMSCDVCGKELDECNAFKVKLDITYPRDPLPYKWMRSYLGSDYDFCVDCLKNENGKFKPKLKDIIHALSEKYKLKEDE